MKKLLLISLFLLFVSNGVFAKEISELKVGKAKETFYYPKDFVCYNYELNDEDLYDKRTGRFIGLKNVEKSLKEAGIDDFEINLYRGEISRWAVYFNLRVKPDVKGLPFLKIALRHAKVRELDFCMPIVHPSDLDRTMSVLAKAADDLKAKGGVMPEVQDDERSCNVDFILKDNVPIGQNISCELWEDIFPAEPGQN